MEQPTKSPMVESRAAKELREAFESGRPLIYVHTSEEQRVGNFHRNCSYLQSFNSHLDKKADSARKRGAEEG